MLFIRSYYFLCESFQLFTTTKYVSCSDIFLHLEGNSYCISIHLHAPIIADKLDDVLCLAY